MPPADFAVFVFLPAFSLVVLGLVVWEPLRQAGAGVVVRLERAVTVGDWVQVDGGPGGRIVRLGWRAVTLHAGDGTVTLVPYSKLLRGVVHEYPGRRPGAWRNVVLACPSAVPPGRVRRLVLDALDGCPSVAPDHPPLVLTAEITGDQIVYQVRFLPSEREPGDVADAAVRTILWYALDRHGLTPGPRPADTAGDKAGRQALLASVRVFAGLSADVLADLAAAARTRRYTLGERIVRQGDEGDELFVVGAGEVLVTVQDPGGKEHEVGRLGRGQFFGEWSLLVGERRSATVRAAAETELIVLARADLAGLLQRAPALVASLRGILEERQAELRERRDGSQEPNLIDRFARQFGLR
jgi:CRP-like cAMP-binding protein